MPRTELSTEGSSENATSLTKHRPFPVPVLPPVQLCSLSASAHCRVESTASPSGLHAHPAEEATTASPSTSLLLCRPTSLRWLINQGRRATAVYPSTRSAQCRGPLLVRARVQEPGRLPARPLGKSSSAYLTCDGNPRPMGPVPIPVLL